MCGTSIARTMGFIDLLQDFLSKSLADEMPIGVLEAEFPPYSKKGLTCLRCK